MICSSWTVYPRTHPTRELGGQLRRAGARTRNVRRHRGRTRRAGHGREFGPRRARLIGADTPCTTQSRSPAPDAASVGRSPIRARRGNLAAKPKPLPQDDRNTARAKTLGPPSVPPGFGRVLELAPTHKAVRAYYDDLAKLAAVGAKHEEPSARHSAPCFAVAPRNSAGP